MSLALASLAFLGALPPPASGQGGPEPPWYLVWGPYVLVLVVFYFLLIAPARGKQQKRQQMLTALKTGDRVMMTCGIYGTIVAIEGDVVQLRIADKVKVDVAKSSVAGLRPDQPKEGTS